MNPLTNMKNVLKLSERELYNNNKTSWHDQYRYSAWIFIGGLPFDLTEGDIICIFSQYGEIVNINLIRDKNTGNSKGFCFLCYEDQRSTDLAVDNFNGIKILNRIIRVDHVSDYKIPKHGKKTDKETKKLYEEGCAPKLQPIQLPSLPSVKKVLEHFDYRETLSDQIVADIRLPERLPIYQIKQEEQEEQNNTVIKIIKEKKSKKHKKEKKKKKKKKKRKYDDSSDSTTSSDNENDKKNKKIQNKSSSTNEKVKDKKKEENTRPSSTHYSKNKQ